MYGLYLGLAVGIFCILWGAFYLFGSEKTLKKFIDWNLSFSVLDLKSRKKLEKRQKSMIKFMGVAMFVIGVALIFVCYWALLRFSSI